MAARPSPSGTASSLPVLTPPQPPGPLIAPLSSDVPLHLSFVPPVLFSLPGMFHPQSPCGFLISFVSLLSCHLLNHTLTTIFALEDPHLALYIKLPCLLVPKNKLVFASQVVRNNIAAHKALSLSKASDWKRCSSPVIPEFCDNHGTLLQSTACWSH